MNAICARCGAPKDVAVGRCAGCGFVPVGEDRVVAVLCSRKVLGEKELLEVQSRILRGEPLRPSGVVLDRARVVLGAGSEAGFTRSQLWWLLVGNLLITPLLGLAVWFRARGELQGRQALSVTIPVMLFLGLLFVGMRWWTLQIVAH